MRPELTKKELYKLGKAISKNKKQAKIIRDCLLFHQEVGLLEDMVKYNSFWDMLIVMKPVKNKVDYYNIVYEYGVL